MGIIRVGIIGVGIMGNRHFNMLEKMKDRFRVTALCDINEAKLQAFQGKECACFSNYKDLIDSALCDAVIVVTPHPCHAEIASYALLHGLHCICEKPLSETVRKTDELISIAKNSGLVFCTNFSMRTRDHVKQIRKWMNESNLGKVIRVDCVCTRWLRSQAYFDGQEWRGSWTGEGGGILMNQTPHNLDLIYHWFGEMKSVKAELSVRMHDIEVEDEVNAVIQMKAGFPVRFYANTGEAPGIDRVEIVCDKGTLISDVDSTGRHVTIRKLEKSVSEMLAGDDGFPQCKEEVFELPIDGNAGGASEIWENFADAIEYGKPLLAPGEEGIYAVELANAMTLSHFTGREIEIPVNRDEYDALLNSLKEHRIGLK